jgi:hypothetical protein
MLVHLKNMAPRVKPSVIFLLWMVHGLFALWQFGTHDSFRPSLPHLTISFVLLLWVIVNAVLAVLEIKSSSGSPAYRSFLKNSNARDAVLVTASLLVLVRVATWYVHGLFDQDLALEIGGYLDILNPILNLIAWVSLELALVILAVNFDPSDKDEIDSQGFFVRFFIILSILMVFVLVISKTGLGILSSYKSDWQRGLPAVALLEWQIILAVVLCLGVFVWERKHQVLNFHRMDLLICSLIWGITCAIWLSQPVVPSPSALVPHEPNFEIYPFIDSQTYDVGAQSLLIGDGFGAEQIPQRPLYIVFLAFVHMLVGQNYNHVIFVQSLVFAFFPVLLFLLGRDLFGRPIGISIALLAILRDHTSNIVAPFTGNLSYSKIYLSEIPTAMMLILFLIIGVRWMRSGFPMHLGALLGGVLGLAMLIRTQTIVLVPVIMLFSLLSQPARIRPMLKSSILMLLVAMLVVSPWLWRNWRITGDLIFDNPESQTMNLALRYSRVNGVDGQVARLPGETSAEFSDRLKTIASEAIRSNPFGAAWALTNSFINHGVNNILLFPLRNEIKSFDELIFPANAFWERWDGMPTRSQALLLGFYIFLFGLGLTVAWQRNGWLGLLPLGLNLIYNLWTSVALLSGQRFMLTMDWSIYFYYMIGMFALLAAFLYALNGSRAMIHEWATSNSVFVNGPAGHAGGWTKILPVALLFFGIGLSLPLVENSFPEKYPPLPQGQLAARLADSSALEGSPVDSVCFKKLLRDESLSIQLGRALYPRYYRAGDGEDFTDTPGYKVVDRGRLVFDVIGQENYRVIFPLQTSPDFFPHASDVSLVYTHEKELWFIFVRQGQNESFYISDEFDRSLCGQ